MRVSIEARIGEQRLPPAVPDDTRVPRGHRRRTDPVAVDLEQHPGHPAQMAGPVTTR